MADETVTDESVLARLEGLAGDDAVTDPLVLEALEAGQSTVAAPAPQAPADPTFMERMGGVANRAKDQALEDVGYQIDNPLGLLTDAPLMTGSQAIRATGDAAVQGVLWTYDQIKEYLDPDVRENLEAGGEWLAKASETMMDYVDKMPGSDYDKRRFGALVDVATAAAPSPLKVVPKGSQARLAKMAKTLEKKAKDQKLDASYRTAKDLMEPTSTKEFKGTYVEEGLLRERQWIPSDRWDGVLRAVEVTPEIKGNRTYTYNHAAVQKAVSGHNKKVTELVSQNNRKLTNADIEAQLDSWQALKDDLLTSDEFMIGGGPESLRLLDNLIDVATRKTAETRSVKGILDARREIDKILRAAKQSAMESGNMTSASIAIHKFRDELNDWMYRSIKNTKVADDVYHHNYMQANLLEADDLLRIKMDMEASNAVQRTWKQLQKNLHLPSTPLAMAATLGAGWAAVSTGLGPPVVAGVAAGAVTGTIIKKALGPGGKKALARMIKAGDDVVKYAKSGDFKAQWAVDRAILVDLMQHGGRDEPEE